MHGYTFTTLCSAPCRVIKLTLVIIAEKDIKLLKLGWRFDRKNLSTPLKVQMSSPNGTVTRLFVRVVTKQWKCRTGGWCKRRAVNIKDPQERTWQWNSREEWDDNLFIINTLYKKVVNFPRSIWVGWQNKTWGVRVGGATGDQWISKIHK